MRPAAALLALALGCGRPASGAPSRAAGDAAGAREPVRSEAWSEGFRLRHGVAADLAPMHDVVVHAPPNYDARAPLHLVIVLHGLGHTALRWAGSGLPDPRTGSPVTSWGGQQRHDLAGTRTLLVVPQLDDRPRHARLGRWMEPGGFRRFLDELLRETLAPRLGAHTLADVETVTFVGSSGGGPSIAELLDRDDLDGRARAVVLFDALYAKEESFARWLRGGDARRLVCLHEGLAFTAPHVETLVGLLRPWMGDALVTEPAGSMTEAVRTHRAVFAAVDCEHIGMGPAFLDKVLLGLGLPRRAPDPDPKATLEEADAPPIALRVGAGVHGALAEGDGLTADGAFYDDHVIALAAGESVTFEARGDAVPRRMCRTLDVELRVFDGDRAVAGDDDGAGGGASRLRFTAARAGRYVVRVSSHGPWAVPGGYSLRAER